MTGDIRIVKMVPKSRFNETQKKEYRDCLKTHVEKDFKGLGLKNTTLYDVDEGQHGKQFSVVCFQFESEEKLKAYNRDHAETVKNAMMDRIGKSPVKEIPTYPNPPEVIDSSLDKVLLHRFMEGCQPLMTYTFTTPPVSVVRPGHSTLSSQGERKEILAKRAREKAPEEVDQQQASGTPAIV